MRSNSYRLRKCKIKHLSGERFSSVRYYDDAEKMLSSEQLDGVLIGTRCSTYILYAVLAAEYKILCYPE